MEQGANKLMMVMIGIIILLILIGIVIAWKTYFSEATDTNIIQYLQNRIGAGKS